MSNLDDILPIYKEKMEDRYSSILMPFATLKAKPNSREHDENPREKENRSDFQRDRDRIIHSKAFRRLMYKTQVFVNHEGDHYRTRLTHTLEVAQFARGICKSLALNEELAEAIALGHDLGHTPFGHAVETYLSKELQSSGEGKFYHNEQSVRIADYLEKRCEDYKGLNLTFEVREGILKHNKDRSEIYNNLNYDKVCSTLEGQIVNKVDTIAYICHDLQDGINAGLIEKAMNKNSEFNSKMIDLKELISRFLNISDDKISFSCYSNTYFINDLIHQFIMKLTDNTVINLMNYSIKDANEVRIKANNNIEMVNFDDETKHIFDNIKSIIYKYIYNLNTIQTMDEKAVQVIKDIFIKFKQNPQLLPPEWYFKFNNIDNSQLYNGAKDSQVRVICDYISTMTDRYALEEHERLYNPNIKI